MGANYKKQGLQLRVRLGSKCLQRLHEPWARLVDHHAGNNRRSDHIPLYGPSNIG